MQKRVLISAIVVILLLAVLFSTRYAANRKQFPETKGFASNSAEPSVPESIEPKAASPSPSPESKAPIENASSISPPVAKKVAVEAPLRVLSPSGQLSPRFAVSFGLTPEEAADFEILVHDAKGKLAEYQAKYATWEQTGEREAFITVP